MHKAGRGTLVPVLAAAVAMGLTSYPASAAAAPNCVLPAGPASKSCVKFVVTPNNPGAPFTNSALFVRFHAFFKPNTSWNSVTLLLDNDFRIIPGTIPHCSKAQLVGKNIAQAWAACGPGAASSQNAYLSPSGSVSGRASTVPPNNYPACTLVFNGPIVNGNPTVLLYLRVTTVANGVANCSNPATNVAGNYTEILVAKIANAGVAGFNKKLTIASVYVLSNDLDGYYATIKRGSYFQARCPTGTTPWKVRGMFTYKPGPYSPAEAADTYNATQPCS